MANWAEFVADQRRQGKTIQEASVLWKELKGEESAVRPAVDAGQSLYRDRAGEGRNQPITEGKANFTTATTNAQEAVASIQETP